MFGQIKYLRKVRVETDALKRNKDLASTRTPRSLVRDEGVAGSNPATPTSFFRTRNCHGERYGGRNPIALAAASLALTSRGVRKKAVLLRMGIGPAVELGRRPS
jgi:hypothetical protein